MNKDKCKNCPNKTECLFLIDDLNIRHPKCRILANQYKVKSLLDYDFATGIIKWKRSGPGRRKSLIAGTVRPDGYIGIQIGSVLYLAHRVAWLYVYGYLPENGLDHINRNRSDNRIENLREVSQQCNMRNTVNPRDNKSGVKGVIWYKTRDRWVAEVRINRKRRHLGYYKNFDNAVCARLAGEQCLNWEGCDSSSPAYMYVTKMIENNTKHPRCPISADKP